MTRSKTKYPVVDVFAGPGGLGEGFASFQDERGNPRFESVASIEMDEFSRRTLHLRHFLRTFPEGEFPDEYYRYLKEEISLEELFALFPGAKEDADKTALKISLGSENHARVRKLINRILARKKKWALVGGPPCQAYSLVGRSRMMSDPEFEKDIRHFLYREYLKIIIDHRPPVFVMENVKGLLSARVNGELVINMIVSDLSNPKAALGNQSNGLGYKLYSLSEDEVLEKEFDPRLFLIKAEEYGVPQCRHRMFIVGIRNDIDISPGRLSRQKPPTVKQVIGGLPSIRSGLSRGRDDPKKWRKEIAQLARMGIKRELNGSEYAGEITSNIITSINSDWFPEERFSTHYPGKSRCQHEAVMGLYDPRLSVLTGHESRGHMQSATFRPLVVNDSHAYSDRTRLIFRARQYQPKNKQGSVGNAHEGRRNAMNRLITYLLGFCVFFVVAVPQHMPTQAETLTDYKHKLDEARQSLTLGGVVTLNLLRDFRDAFANGNMSKDFADSFQSLFEPAHGFDVVMEQLAQRPAERYSLDKSTLSSMGLTPSESNIIKLRNGIRHAFGELTHGHLRDVVNPGVGLYIYYDSASQTFNSQLRDHPRGKPYFRLTSGHIMDFAFVDGVTLGKDSATQDMSSKLDKTFTKFKTRKESNAITSICNSCLDQSQVKKGLAFCYLAGLAKGDALRDQLLTTSSGRASLSGDRIAAAVRNISTSGR